MRIIWNKVLFKLVLSFDGLVSRKDIFSYYIHRIEKDIGVVVDITEVQSSVSFRFYLGEDFIDFCWADIVIEGPHATIFNRISNFLWFSLLVNREHSFRILVLWLFHLVWLIIMILNHNMFGYFLDISKLRLDIGKIKSCFFIFLSLVSIKYFTMSN